MIEIKYDVEKIKTLLKEKKLQKFLKYIKLRAIEDKSQATDDNIVEIVNLVKEVGKKEVMEILNFYNSAENGAKI